MKCSCRSSTEACPVIPPFQCVCTCGRTEESVKNCRYQGDDHNCVCRSGNGCRMKGEHVCSCEHDPISCLGYYHYCTCKSFGTDKCLGAEIEPKVVHRCTCRENPDDCKYICDNEQFVCRPTGHDCSCDRFGDERCRQCN